MHNDTDSIPKTESKDEITNFQSALNQSGIALPAMDAEGALYISAVMDYVTSVAIKRSAKLLSEKPETDSPCRKKRRLEPQQVQRALAGDNEQNPMFMLTDSERSFSKMTICIDGDPCSGKTELVKALCKEMARDYNSGSKMCLENLCPDIVSEFYKDTRSFYSFQVHALTSLTRAVEIQKLRPRLCLLLDRGSISLDALAFHFVAKKVISAQQFHLLRKLHKHCLGDINVDVTVYIFDEDPSRTKQAIVQAHPGAEISLSDLKSISELRFELLLRHVAAGKRKIIFIRKELLDLKDCFSTINKVLQGSERPPWVKYNPGFLSQEEHRSKSRLVYSTTAQLKGATAAIERSSNLQSKTADTVYFHVKLWNWKSEFRIVCLYHLARFEDICLYKCPGEDLDQRTSSVVKFLWPS